MESNKTYYYQAVITLANGSDVEGDIMSFQTDSPGAVTNRGNLANYEFPWVSPMTYSTGAETFGSTSWHAYGTSNPKQMVVVHTFSYNGTKRNYSMLYDGDKRCALWVAFVMNTDSYPWLVDRNDDWKPDPAIPLNWMPNMSSGYAESSTYDRGHQAASNDRRTTTYQTKQTTYYSNMTPQLGGFNGGVWSSLEGDIQKIGKATSGSDSLYVVTGPIFGSGYGTTKDKDGKDCAVPTQYFKCIMKVSFSGGTPEAATGAAYLLDHISGATRQEVTIAYIQQLTGFDFFANIPSGLQSQAEAETHPTSYFPQSNN